MVMAEQLDTAVVTRGAGPSTHPREGRGGGPAPSVAMVLGAGVWGDRPSPYLAARLDVAASLWRDGAVSVILVSGHADESADGTLNDEPRYDKQSADASYGQSSAKPHHNEPRATTRYDEPRVMANYLINHGVPAHVIVRDGKGLDTWTSCLRAQRVYQLSSLVVVTQSYHLPRALASCRLIGMHAVGAPDRTRWPRTRRRWWRYRLREIPAWVKLVFDRATMHGAAGLEIDDAVVELLNRL